MAEELPRGLRNHNPLNIRKSTIKWQGMAKEQKDKSFITFTSDEYGYRAALKTLHTYMIKYNIRTLSGIIKRWAPPTENNTQGYIRRVSEISGISPLINIYFTSKEDMIDIVHAMAIVENGGKYANLISKDKIRTAYEMIM